MEDFQKVYSRRLIRVCRGIAGVLLVGCVSVMTGLLDVRVYNNEVDYARESMDKEKFKPHRCNDRLADMLEVIEAEDGNMWQDLRPAFRNWWACMRSAEGAEPVMPYLMLTAKDKQYIDPASRRVRGETVQQLST
ncbi:hypothetical protein VOLCADRAFT_107414 [Volvox carteri f. nagariensis]|uniref:Uncharacterized protein n=1 Tax=Volvox carteri f. nagariensis TaxID=3068 RepID=D8UDV9_VOLCA|nr:uncharacterized protein VOLCADRAFT_107414 [Volvox carteri f. nagariensis]EFJ42160.1 hypothetical protein VOLCADRAFT_107414 [Volvox carteri f. nagariensis]|eukprot:XP_002956857.1 hypothetical protein VOLCADRAFT_107414 [Volvox carteri f. nagariensis]